MLTVGIDSGSQNTKGVLLRDGQVLGRAAQPTLFDVSGAAEAVMERLLTQSGVKREDVTAVAATGVGRGMVRFSDGEVNRVIAAALAGRYMVPGCLSVMEMGAEGSCAICLQADGSVRNYTSNDKCASGGGMFIETVARVLQISTEELGQCALAHTRELPMNAQCVVFVESEVISLIHRNERKEDIAHAVLSGLAGRLGAMARSLELTDSVVFLGGPAKNPGLTACLKQALNREVLVPEYPEYAGALGAALWAAQGKEA